MPRSHNNVTWKQTDFQNMQYTNRFNHSHTIQVMGQGKAKHSLTGTDILREVRGFTNPDLHRRVVSKQDRVIHSNNEEKEYTQRDYELEIEGVHSYRFITHPTHLENTTEDETP